MTTVIISLTPRLQDNIDCEARIIFDNDEDKTDPAILFPYIAKARKDVRTLRQLQLPHLRQWI
ncbi:TPA: hypothetical protein O7M80_002487 [Escherichia coli]|uniref:hypothetical protein n=1 Tax=Escherichia coli TaxID=562 RepID=UPI001FF67B3C|nr:hypothetical protein [Escherichia coli]MCJ8492391.1 hypothetical protein [Escherichia coli]HDB9330121.1 hypothetical protein [Escherichia coli]